jgi:glutamate racemase
MKDLLTQLKNNSKYKRIGLFDSGIGGISVVHELEKINPNGNIVYLGDNKNFPYGDKTHKELINIVKKDIEYLISKNISVLGIACNTATSVIHEEYPEILKSALVFNPISSVCEYIKKNKDMNRVLVIGSKYTVSSRIYERFLDKERDLKVLQASEQLLIEHIEQSDKQRIQDEILRIKKNIERDGIDTLVLGCTHYGYVKDIFRNELPNIQILDPSEIMARDISKVIDLDGIGERDIVFTKELT